MRLRHIIPHVGLLLLAQAVIDAAPAIIAEREGGMGLGSALIGAHVMQISGLALGATLSGYLADRRSVSAAVLTGVLVHYVGLMTTAMSPMGSLASVIAGMGVAGIGHGFLLTAAFATAAGMRGGDRIVAIGLLVGVPLASRLIVGTVLAAGPATLLVGAALVVALAVVAARSDLTGARPMTVRKECRDASGPAGPRTVLAGMLLGAGALLAVAGVEPSRLSASLVVGALGAGAFGALDAARAVMFSIGSGLVLAGMTVLLADRRVAPRIAVPSVLLAAMAGTGIASALVQATRAGRAVEGAAALAGASGAIGGGLGLLIAAVLVARGGARHTVAIAGSVLLLLGAGLGLAMLGEQRPGVGDLRPIALIALVGFASALTATALRHWLADVDPDARGRAAGAGVAAAGIGASIGSMIGAGEGIRMVTEAVRGPGPGSIGLVGAALAAAALVVALPRGRSAVDSAGSSADP